MVNIEESKNGEEKNKTKRKEKKLLSVFIINKNNLSFNFLKIKYQKW